MSIGNYVHGIHHINIQCQTLDQYKNTIFFYNSLLEFDEIAHWENGEKKVTLLDAKGTRLEIAYSNQAPSGKGIISHIALHLEKIDSVINFLADNGVEILLPVKDVVIQSEIPQKVRLAFVKGFAGEEIELFETF